MDLQNINYFSALMQFYKNESSGKWDWKYLRGYENRIYYHPRFGSMRPDEFGNYFAGFIGQARFGTVGHFLVRIFGHVFAFADPTRILSSYPFDDPGSIIRINQGAMDVSFYDPSREVCQPCLPLCVSSKY